MNAALFWAAAGVSSVGVFLTLRWREACIYRRLRAEISSLEERLTQRIDGAPGVRSAGNGQNQAALTPSKSPLMRAGELHRDGMSVPDISRKLEIPLIEAELLISAGTAPAERLSSPKL